MIKELEQKRSLALKDATAALRSDKPSEERYKTYDEKVAEIGKLDEEIARHRSAEKFEAEERAAEDQRRSGNRPNLPQPGAPVNDDRSASKEELEERNRKYSEAHTLYLRTRDESQLRAMNSTTGANGGYTIPTVTHPILTQAELAYGGVIPYLQSQETSTGELINWPLNNDTANLGRELAENVPAQETDLTIGTTPLSSGLFSTDMVNIPRTLLRDSVVDLQTIIVTALAIRRARLLASKVINGSNTGSFTSLLTGATVGATSAAPAAVGLTDLSLLFGAVDPAYALNGKFVMHRSMQIYLATLRNDLGAPIFPLDENQMLTKIFGCQIVVDQGMPAVVANTPVAGTKYILYGDLKSYIFRPVGSMEVMRLDERYAEYNQVAFMGWYSAGGALIDAGTHPVQVLQQHA